MTFKTELQVIMSAGSGNRTLTAPLIYVDSVFGEIIVPSGFTTNYASIPSIIPRWWLDQDDPLIREPSVIHDWLYSIDCLLRLTRKEADEVLLRAMLGLVKGNWYRKNMDKTKCYSAYYSVRGLGQSHWKKL